MPQQTVDAMTLKRWLEAGEAALVDVREPAEHQASHIADSTLVPLSRVSKAALPETGGRKLVIHCLKGGRGTSACARLLAEDPALEIYHLEGGIGAWQAAGLPVVTQVTGRRVLPLDRQVQLTIGIGLLTGSALGYFFSPLFFLLTGFFGAGLTVAGLTGFCGLARVMARMPWNQK